MFVIVNLILCGTVLLLVLDALYYAVIDGYINVRNIFIRMSIIHPS